MSKAKRIEVLDTEIRICGLSFTFFPSIGQSARHGKGWMKTPGKTPGKTPDRILAALRENPELSIPEIARELEKSESAVERAIRKLRQSGKLERIGPAKGGHWKVLDKVKRQS